jgi:hypothetical protein
MRGSALRILLAAGIFFGFSQSAHAAAPSSIQMLPPTDFSNTACNVSGKPGILYWDGVNPIRCIPGSSGDSTGNVNFSGALAAGAFALAGETLGPLNGSDSDTLTQLNQLAGCSSDQLLTKNSANQFVCQTYIDAASLGTYAFPSCPGGALNWNDTGNPATSAFACVTMPATPPVCNGAGQMLQFDGTNFQCVTAAAPPTPPTCNGTGQVLQFDGTNFQCVTPAPGGNGAPCASVTNFINGTTSTTLSLPAAPDGYAVVWATTIVANDDSSSDQFTLYQCQNGTWTGWNTN